MGLWKTMDLGKVMLRVFEGKMKENYKKGNRLSSVPFCVMLQNLLCNTLEK